MLFIDELHTLVGAGGAEGAIDAPNVLKPALARGESVNRRDDARRVPQVHQKDQALGPRFQSIIVKPAVDAERWKS